MGKKKQKKLAEMLGDAQVVLFDRYQLDSSIQPKNLGPEYGSRITLDLMGKNILGSLLNTVHVHFLPDGETLPAPQSFGEYIICHQPMQAFKPMMHMLESGIDYGLGSSFFYGTYSTTPPSLEFSLLSGELTQKQMMSMLKKDLEIKHQDEVGDNLNIPEKQHKEELGSES